MEGRYCRVEPLDADKHAAELHAANTLDEGAAEVLGKPFELAELTKAILKHAPPPPPVAHDGDGTLEEEEAP